MPVAPSKRLPRALVERKRRFRKALALAEMTAEQFAEQHGVTATYLSRYLGGKTVSGPMAERVDAFIAAHLRSVA